MTAQERTSLPTVRDRAEAAAEGILRGYYRARAGDDLGPSTTRLRGFVVLGVEHAITEALASQALRSPPEGWPTPEILAKFKELRANGEGFADTAEDIEHGFAWENAECALIEAARKQERAFREYKGDQDAVTWTHYLTACFETVQAAEALDTLRTTPAPPLYPVAVPETEETRDTPVWPEPLDQRVPWQHAKGGVYVIAAEALDEETLEPLIVYGRCALSGDYLSCEAGLWSRKRSVFLERFKPISLDTARAALSAMKRDG